MLGAVKKSSGGYVLTSSNNFFMFEELNKLGTTVIIATHNSQMVERMGYPRMHLDEGWLEIIGGEPSRLPPDLGSLEGGDEDRTNYETLI